MRAVSDVEHIDEQREARATVWVDTNVMHEIMGQGDLFREERWGPIRIEMRRMLLQGSLWFAIVLDENATTSLSFWHEVDTGMVRLAPPGTAVGGWTAIATHVLQPYVFPRWDGIVTRDGQDIFDDETKKRKQRRDELDALIVQRCAARGLTLVSRDMNPKGAIAKARKAGTIEVLTPEEYAESRMSRDQARERFLERLCIGAIHRIAERGRGAVAQMEMAMGVFTGLWEPPESRPANPPLSLDWPWCTKF